MSFLSNLFGFKSVDYKSLMQNGAIILDVRTPQEFNGGHIKGSVNIPLQVLQSSLGKIPRNKIVITCCASGMRSASAKSLLKSAGYHEVHNGGGWMSLKSKL
jgi:phage shock protein E